MCSNGTLSSAGAAPEGATQLIYKAIAANHMSFLEENCLIGLLRQHKKEVRDIRFSFAVFNNEPTAQTHTPA
jgi:hypothetical protein